MDFEAEYNNGARVPEYPGIVEGWVRAAAAYRAGSDCELDIAYGRSLRARLDLFKAGDGSGPVGMFIHGGYWQRLDKTVFSHMARGLNDHGITVAVPSYDLCPDVSMAAIVSQMRECAAFLWRRFKQPVIPFGHSAGGHLTAMLLATRWPGLDRSLPAGLTPAGFAISGLFDLVPLVPTSINEKLGMDEAAAAALSPLFLRPPPGRTLIATVGALESDDFRRQTRLIANVWRAHGVKARACEEPGANHFTVINPLADPDSKMVALLKSLFLQPARRN